ncbi:MAG: DUF1565 domain-containing protein [Myxococcales bacterium]|nr:DUF1565 domain-containing protein [Myxococcales bacterium]
MGTSLICPSGFVQTPPTEAGALPGCAPDPAACGSDAFGGVAEGQHVAFVDGAFGGSSTGSRAAPFVTIGQAIANLPQGGTIAVAAGTYTGKLEWAAPIDLRGRCPALVVLTTAGSANIIRVETAKAAGSRVADLTLAGAVFVCASAASRTLPPPGCSSLTN